MNFSLKPLIRKHKIRKDGTVVISIQYCFNSDQRILLDSGLSIPPSYWNTKTETILASLPSQYGHSIELNQMLKQQLRKVEDILFMALRRNNEAIIPFVKKYFNHEETIECIMEKIQTEDKLSSKGDVFKNMDIFFQIDHYIQTKQHKVSKDMPRIYRNMKDHLLDFQIFRKSPITFDCLDIIFYEELVSYLMYDYVIKRRKDQPLGLKTNTVGKTVKQLKVFLKDRIRKGIIPPIDMTDWVILTEDVDAIYLSVDEIEKIYQLDLSGQPTMMNYKENFVLGCLTGLRFSDFSNIQQSDLRNNLLFKKQQKSEHLVVIPLRKNAKEILARRRFEHQQDLCYTKFNGAIKTLAKLAGVNELITHSYKKGNKMIKETRPKCDWVTTHTCRRSFCTNEFLAGTPTSLIMKISGHKSERDFYRYIRISPEEAAYKIQELWKERGEL